MMKVKRWNFEQLADEDDDASRYVLAQLQNAGETLAKACLLDSAAELDEAFCHDLLRVFGPGYTQAMILDNTKDRRDALRKHADFAMTYDAMRASGSELQFSRMPIKGKRPDIRNRILLHQIQATGLGIVSPQYLQHVADVTPSHASLRDCINKDYEFRLTAVTPVTKILGKVADVFLTRSIPMVIEVDDTNELPTTTEEKEVPTMTNTDIAVDPSKFEGINATIESMIDSNLNSIGLPKLQEIGSALSQLSEKAAKSEAGVKLTLGPGMEYKPTGEAKGKIPTGKPTLKRTKDIFGLTGKAAAPFEFDVPVYEWDDEHPFVPAIDKDYRFQPEQMMAILTAIITNQRTWLYGDTGCGKTTVVEQVAARLKYPVIRVNFDSEITRMDLIGAKDIVVSSGHPVTIFTEGVLPQAMQQPCILLADELDFIRADVAYVFQRALEGNGLILPEDAGRMIMPHPGFRIIATGNTQGAGDESGRYQGAKPQSAAFLDRFTLWVQCDYMKEEEAKKLIEAKYHSIGGMANTLAKYAKEHWVAFKNGEVLTALSPRGLLSCAMTYTIFRSVMDDKKAMTTAMKMTFLNRANPEDAQTIKGLITRVM